MPMTFKALLGSSVLAVLLTACGKPTVAVTVQSDRTIEAHGIKYRVPWETSSHTQWPTSFTYEGEPFTISEIGGRLRVDRKDYGRVQAGDTVSVLKGGKVLVNDAERTPQ
jgi:hypothetical protein